ncbi:hypothetical protein HGRIS_014051 [Hohenbuehelia grisea]|uniref:Uncharacterized protein n=1 Tax=Hohenbuehelia grisea TaxID=104357 RepID=A0ABR3JUC7_9AGAR
MCAACGLSRHPFPEFLAVASMSAQAAESNSPLQLSPTLPSKPAKSRRSLQAQLTNVNPPEPCEMDSSLNKHARYYRRHREEMKAKARHHWHTRGKHLRAAKRAQDKDKPRKAHEDVQNRETDTSWKDRTNAWLAMSCVLANQFSTMHPSRAAKMDSKVLAHCCDGDDLISTLELLEKKGPAGDYASLSVEIKSGKEALFDDYCEWWASRK